MNPTDETVLARFASGDMSIEEETEFLAHCESQPELWRTAALALVEHRQIALALRAFVNMQHTEPKKQGSRASRKMTVRWSTLLFAAACLLGLMIGGVSLAYWAGKHANPLIAESENSPVFVHVQPPAEQFSPNIDHFQWPTMQSPEAIAERLAEVHSRPVFPGEARSILREVGVAVEEEPILYILDDGSGERFAIPSRNFHLRYVNHQD